MTFNRPSSFSKTARLIAIAVGLCALTGTAGTSVAQTSIESPAPLLEQISQQTQALHRRVSASLVRVRLPDHSASEIGAAEELLRKWEQRLEPMVKQKLQEQAATVRAMRTAMAEDDPFAWMRGNPDRIGSAVLVVRPFDPGDLAHQMPLGLMNLPRGRAAGPGTLAVVMDGRGLLLVPAFIDREWAGQRTMHVTLSEGTNGEAVFVGSDQATGISLLRLSIPAGRPAELASDKPADGALVMTFATQTEAAKLSVWTRGVHEVGMIVTADGRIAGFANDHQFLSAAAVVPVVKQLSEQGTVRRAAIGIRVSEIPRDDPFRQLVQLGSNPGMHVDKVQSGSPAEKSGLRAGDVILAVGSEPVGDVPSFAAAMAVNSGRLPIRLLRDGQVIQIAIDLRRE